MTYRAQIVKYQSHLDAEEDHVARFRAGVGALEQQLAASREGPGPALEATAEDR